MQLQELKLYLNQLLPSNSLTDFCPNGLQVEGKTNVTRLATAVSANLETIEAAIEQQIDALIVHHGLFWQRDGYQIEGTKRKKLLSLLENEISLFAYHLPLDMHPLLGNNWKAAKDLAWTDLQPFGYFSGSPIGVRGRISPCSREELKKTLEAYYQHPAVCAWGGNSIIQTVALISGGAHKTILEAAEQGVDAFITGSFDEPTWHQAKEEGVNFFALGHSATERIGPMALANHLKETLGIDCHFIDIDNPF